MIFGTFDRLHEGHKYFIREARILADELIIIVARDHTVQTLKGSLPTETEEIRKSHIEKMRVADLVLLGNTKDHLAAIKLYKPDIILLGYDQRYFADTVIEDLRRMGLHHTKVIRAKAFEPDKYKSSRMKDALL